MDSAFECSAPRRLGSVAGPRGPGLLRPQSILPASSTQSRCYTSHPTVLTLLSDKEHFQNSSPSAKNGHPGRYQMKEVSGWSTLSCQQCFHEQDAVAVKSAGTPTVWGREEAGNHVLKGMGRKRGRRRTRRERTKCQHLNWDTQRASSY